MRRIALILMLLLVGAPAMATVTITAEQDASNPCQVWIGYESDEAELIRAFALDIMVEDGNIIDVNDYAVGDDNGGYGIFPGSFAAAPVVVNPTTGEVENWDVAGYGPVAPAGDPDALPGIGTSGVTIEMGSLYDTAAPSQSSGILCSVTLSEGTSKLCVTANAIRGNVVLESAAEVQNLVLPDDSGNGCIQLSGCGNGPCYPASCTTTYDDWIECGQPDCWCGNVFPKWRYQCDGDCDGETETFFKYRVFGMDLACVVENWKKKCSDPMMNPCADFDHKTETFFKYRVFGNDLAILISNWKKKDSALGGDCPRCP